MRRASRPAWAVGAALFVLALLGACRGSPETCPDGMGLLCLSDGTTCTCAPSCTAGVDYCEGWALCTDNGTCRPCVERGIINCICEPNIGKCAPSSWVPGQDITFAATTACTPASSASSSADGGSFVSCPEDGGSDAVESFEGATTGPTSAPPNPGG